MFTIAFPLLLPHRVTGTLLLSYLDEKIAHEVEEKMLNILGRDGFNWQLRLISDRPPMKKRHANRRLAKDLTEIARKWEIPLSQESSLWPSVAGLVPRSTEVICGIGPVVQNLYTPNEAVQRISFMQRTLLLAQFLSQDIR